MTARTTTILGQVFAGRPMMGSNACRIWLLEQDGKIAEAEALLRAYRMLGQGDLSGDFTDLPMEGMQTYPAVPPLPRERFSWHIDDETGRGSIAA